MFSHFSVIFKLNKIIIKNREGDGAYMGEGRVHPQMSHQFITGPYVSIWRFSTFPKGCAFNTNFWGRCLLVFWQTEKALKNCTFESPSHTSHSQTHNNPTLQACRCLHTQRFLPVNMDLQLSILVEWCSHIYNDTWWVPWRCGLKGKWNFMRWSQPQL